MKEPEDYLKLFENVDPMELQKRLSKRTANKSEMIKITTFAAENNQDLLDQYIEGLKNNHPISCNISYTVFCICVYVLKFYKNDNDFEEEFEEETKPEVKPKSMKLQKELDEMYTDENVNKAIESLGIFTEDERDQNGEQ